MGGTLLFYLSGPSIVSSQTYKLVTSIDKLTSGDSYVISSENTLQSGTMAGSFSSGKLLGVACPSTTYKEFTITSTSAGYTIKDGDSYISGLSSGTGLGENTSCSSTNKYCHWAISASADTPGQYLIKNNGNSNSLSYSVGDKYFKAFSSIAAGIYQSVYLFKKSASTLVSPIFSQTSKKFATSFNISLTADAGISIYYTTDGTDPSSSSTLYSEPITISASTTLKVIAIKGEETSDVVTATYTKVEPISVRLGGESNLGTFYADYPVCLPEGVTAYTIGRRDEKRNCVTLSEYSSQDGTLPANTPFILKGNSSTALSMAIAENSTVAPIEYDASLVKGTIVATAAPTNKNVYVLGYGEDGTSFGFCQYKGTDLIPANRVFLTADLAYTLITDLSSYSFPLDIVIANGITEDGKPAGLCAGEYSSDKKAVLLVDLATAKPVSWTMEKYAAGYKLTNNSNTLYRATYNTISSSNGTYTWKFTSNASPINSYIINSTSETGSYFLMFGDTYFKIYGNSTGNYVYLFTQTSGTSAGVKLYTFDFSGTLGIRKNTVGLVNKAAIYSLSGKLQSHPTAGLNIINGKKILY